MNALEVSGVSVVFGGLRAVDDLSFRVAEGSIKGVIGPNGAGKTTLFNAISGITRQSSGTVRLGATDVTGLAPHSRAALGLARTFQNLQIFGGMNVIENVMVGRHTRLRAGWSRGLLGLGTAKSARPKRSRSKSSRCSVLLTAPAIRRRASALPKPSCSKSRERSPPSRRCCSSMSRWRACR